MRKNSGGFDPAGWLEDPKSGWRELDGGDLLAHAFDPCVAASQEKRHIGTELQAQFFQRGQVQLQVPKAVESQQASGCIGGAAAHACLRRDAFFDRNVNAIGAARVTLQQACRSGDQVLRGQCHRQIFPADGPV